MEPAYTQFFRCMMCAKLIEMTEWLTKGFIKCSCGGGRFAPARLRWWEIVIYLVTHPLVFMETIKGRIWQ